jgi:glutathione peroxidase
MKMNIILFGSMLLSSLFGCKQTATRPETMTTTATKTLYDFKMKSIDGQEIDLSKYKGKKVLIVNTASECGYTPQYADLQKLNEQYGSKVIILGFPANNFGAQEPDSNKKITSFCTKNYGVTFQMFEKISVTGADQADLYKWLSHKDQNGWNDNAPSWNFCKYLINEKGELIKFYPSKVNPMSDEITKAL